MSAQPVRYLQAEDPIYSIRPRRKRKPGVSAFLRLRNEAEWLPYSLESIAGIFQETILITQGVQVDGTDEICRASGLPYYHYPYLSVPNGEGHDQQKRGSVHERAYFYNWCLSKTSCEYACKWDGDMLAFDWFGDWLSEQIKNRPNQIKFHGVDVVGDIHHIGKRKHCAAEWRVFKVTDRTFYYTAAMTATLRTPYAHTNCEIMHTPYTGGVVCPTPAFLHTKWAKQNNKEAWPTNWLQSAHFREINKRAQIAGPYTGELPACLQVSGYLFQ